MSSRQSKRYLQRVHAAAGQAGAGTDLSEAALLFVRQPSDRLPAGVFQELLQKGYLQPSGRTWAWTMRAQALRR